MTKELREQLKREAMARAHQHLQDRMTGLTQRIQQQQAEAQNDENGPLPNLQVNGGEENEAQPLSGVLAANANQEMEPCEQEAA